MTKQTAIRATFDCPWCGSMAVTDDERCPSANVPPHARHTPDQAADGTAHLAYFDVRTQRSYIWNGRAAFVQVSVGGYGEPATEAIPAPVFSGRVDKQVDPRDFAAVCMVDAVARRTYGEYEPYDE